MRILYAISYSAGMAGESGGVLRYVQACMHMARSQGAAVAVLSPWDKFDPAAYDLVHLAPANIETLGLVEELCLRQFPFVVSPIIDKTASNRVIRLVARIDQAFGRIVHTHLGAARTICQSAVGVCLMSPHEAERVKQGLGVRHARARVIPVPIAPSDFDAVDAGLYTQAHGTGAFVLCAGDLANPRKNALRLVEACAKAKLPLVLVGSLAQTPYGRKVERAIARSPEARHLGFVSRPMLLSAMKACRVFALPSLTEGFGIAAMEAGALGAQVAITRHGAPSYFFGDKAWYIDPYSTGSIEAALRRAWAAPRPSPLRAHLVSTLRFEVVAPSLARLYSDAVGCARRP